MLDHRLSLAASLYVPCRLGCDIGSDHALLPCHLLRSGTCERMIVSDISEKALMHAAYQVHHQHLEDRVQLICADGLEAVTEPCGCISITGMGGETAAQILLSGQDRLHGCTLVISVHTDPFFTRQAIEKIGYRFTAEKLVYERGRYYIVWQCMPGFMHQTEEEVLYGSLLYKQPSELLTAYLQFRISVYKKKLTGLLSGRTPKAEEIVEAERALHFYQARLQELGGRDDASIDE